MMYEKKVMTPMMVAPPDELDESPSPATLPGMNVSHGRICWNVTPYEFSHSPAQMVHSRHRHTRNRQICATYIYTPQSPTCDNKGPVNCSGRAWVSL